MNNLQIFKNSEFGSVRTMTVNGEVMFVGKDVAEALGYSNTKDALAVHVDEEDKTIIQRSENATFEIPNRGMTIINESGLYSLIIGSKLPTAKKFKHWVTSEVLPSIRKTGSYSVHKSDKALEIQEMNAKTRYANMFLKLCDVDTLSKEYKNILVAKAAEILAGERILPLPQGQAKTYTATEIGKMFGVSANKIGKLSKEYGLKIDEYGEWYRSKSQYSSKEVDTFVYNEKAVAVFQRLLNGESL